MRIDTILLIVGLLLILFGTGFLVPIGCGMIGWVIGGMLAEDLILKNGK